ncbi:MAG: hypothetical protein AVDCRST_MAG68-5006, partial [uncultured Gemmatimonadetes bacterium]
ERPPRPHRDRPRGMPREADHPRAALPRRDDPGAAERGDDLRRDPRGLPRPRAQRHTRRTRVRRAPQPRQADRSTRRV